MPINSQMHTTTRINHPINIFYQSKVLLRVIDAFIYVRFGKKDSMPMHVGDTNKWRRWGNPDAIHNPASYAGVKHKTCQFGANNFFCEWDYKNRDKLILKQLLRNILPIGRGQ